MDESMTTKHLTHQIKERVTHLCVMILELAQAYKRNLTYHPFDHLASWYKKTNEIGPLHTLDMTKMKHLGGGGIPQGVGLSDFLKNKLQKIAR